MDQTHDRITVVGFVDPVAIVYKLRKILFTTDVISVEEVEEVKYKKEEGKKDDKKMPAYYRYDLGGQMNPTVKEFTLENLNHMTDNFSEDRIIGRGRYGAIYKVYNIISSCIFIFQATPRAVNLLQTSFTILTEVVLSGSTGQWEMHCCDEASSSETDAKRRI